MARAAVGQALEGPDLLTQLLTINVLLLLFNLLPAFPMDGGRVLRALLATRFSYARATQIAASIGQGFAFVFGFRRASLESIFDLHRAVRLHRRFAGGGARADARCLAPISGFERDGARVSHSAGLAATLQEAVDALLATSQHDFPVLDENGNVAGILTRHDLDCGFAQR